VQRHAQPQLQQQRQQDQAPLAALVTWRLHALPWRLPCSVQQQRRLSRVLVLLSTPGTRLQRQVWQRVRGATVCPRRVLRAKWGMLKPSLQQQLCQLVPPLVVVLVVLAAALLSMHSSSSSSSSSTARGPG
jgi:hypothetical protein